MGLVRPASLYMLTVAASGDRKTSADELALAPVRRAETARSANSADARAAYENALAAWEQQRKLALRAKGASLAEREQALHDVGPRPEPPLVPFSTCPEPTFEGLSNLFRDGQPSLGLFSSEGGQFLGGHSMGADHRQKTAAGLNALWDGAPLRRVRAGDGAYDLPGRRLSVHLLVQPLAAHGVLADDMLADLGTLSRLLVAAPASLVGTRRWREPPAEARAALDRYHDRLASILGEPLPLAEGRRNELRPRRLALAPRARELWVRFADDTERRMADGGEFEPIRPFAGKLPEHATRIAAVVALTEDLHAGEIGEEDLARGIEVANHHASEWLRLVEARATDPMLRRAQRVLDWLRESWPEPLVSLPDIYRNGPRAVRDRKSAGQVAGVLQDHGWLSPVPGGAVVAGSRRRKVWEVRRDA